MAVYGENLRSVGGEIVDLEEQGLAVVGPGRHVTGIARNKGPGNIAGQQGQQGQKKPWEAMEPILPAGRGGPTVADQGAQLGRVLNQGMMANVLGTPDFIDIQGNRHAGRPSAHQGMVGDVNAAWADYARRQGRFNTIKMIMDRVYG